jgi:hypothetical protein
MVLTSPRANALVYNISQQTNLVAVDFRGQPNTTYFAWAEGNFFGLPVPPSASRILNNPTPSFGLVTGVEF